MTENDLHLLHYYSKSEWNLHDQREIKKLFEDVGSRFTEQAARGEGCGGTGFETEVHLLIELGKGIAVALAYDIIKKIATSLAKRRPKKKRIPKDMEGGDSYRLLFYLNDAIINVDLDCSSAKRKVAFDKLEKRLKKLEDKFDRLYQSGSTWTEI